MYTVYKNVFLLYFVYEQMFHCITQYYININISAQPIILIIHWTCIQSRRLKKLRLFYYLLHTIENVYTIQRCTNQSGIN